jgi:hypothetical protein
MATPVKLKKFGSTRSGEHNFAYIFRKLAQQSARRAIASATALTQSSGGTAGIVGPVALAVGGAADGSNLAGKATSEAAFTTVLDALGELYTKANALATTLSVPTVTNSGGGATPDGTVDALTVTVTGAATGILVADTNTFLTALNKSVYNLAIIVRNLCRATHNTEPTMASFGAFATRLTTIPAITISGGTAASPGVLKTEAEAALAKMRVNVKTLGDLLNTIIATQTALVVAV